MDVAPSVVACQGVTTRAHQLIGADFSQQLQVELIKRIDAAFTDVKTAEDKELLIKDEARVVASTVRLLAHEAQLNPVAHEFVLAGESRSVAGPWAHALLVAGLVRGRFTLSPVLHFLHCFQIYCFLLL